MNQTPTIIISRTDSIGDVVLTLPMAGVLKKKFPHSRIVFLGRKYTRDVVALSIHVDEFIDFDEVEKLSITEQVEALKKIHAGVIIHVFPSAKIASLAKKARIPVRAGTTNRLFHWITCNKLIRLSRKNSDLHEAELNLKLIAFLGAEQVPREELYHFYGFTKLPSLDPVNKSLLDLKRKNIILHPKSKGSAREWGLRNFSELIKLMPHDRFKIFISGTSDDGNKMRDFLKENHTVVDLTGKLSLQQFIAFIAFSDGLVAASTGPLHIAAALSKKAIGLFSSRRPIHPGRWGPVGKFAYALVADESCKKCMKKEDCNCIEKITPQQIVDLLNA